MVAIDSSFVRYAEDEYEVQMPAKMATADIRRLRTREMEKPKRDDV
jgi:hypothetical protein